MTEPFDIPQRDKLARWMAFIAFAAGMACLTGNGDEVRHAAEYAFQP